MHTQKTGNAVGGDVGVNGVRPVYTSTDLYPQPRNGCVQRPKLSSSDDLFAKKGPSTG